MTRENGYIERTSHSHLCFRLQPIRIHINSNVSIAVSLTWERVGSDRNDFHVVLSIEGVQTTLGVFVWVHLFG